MTVSALALSTIASWKGREILAYSIPEAGFIIQIQAFETGNTSNNRNSASAESIKARFMPGFSVAQGFQLLTLADVNANVAFCQLAASQTRRKSMNTRPNQSSATKVLNMYAHGPGRQSPQGFAPWPRDHG